MHYVPRALRLRFAGFGPLAFLAAVLWGPGCALPVTNRQVPPAGATRDPKPGWITVKAVGDIMLGSAYPDESDLPPHGGARLLRDATPVLRSADLTFGNLEGPLCDNGASTKSGPRSYAFRVPTRYGRHLQAAGFDVLSLANNHASDFGAAGRKSTRAVLDKLGIGHAGGDKNDADVRVVNYVRVTTLAFATNAVSLNLNDVAGARAAVAKAARDADIVIVSFHGGGEGAGYQHVARGPETYLGESRGDLRRFARAVVDAGADLVLGHGPHVVRGMEVYKGRLIAYSLGNFATYGKFGLSGPTGLSLILEARVSSESGAFLGGRIHPFRQVKPGGPKRDPSGAVLPVIARLSKQDFGPAAVRVGKNGTLAAPPALGSQR